MLFIIDEILEEMALENKSHFSPRYICNRSGIHDLKAVTEYLIQLVGQKLRVTFEVECPEGDSDFAVESPHELSNEKRICHICGVEYIPNPERIWVAFDFLPEYKQYVKKKRNLNPLARNLALV
ncbi:hypothetical protein M3205_06120 [Cytobacillus firmus]|uniref:hypothetical protein n=1 Tax=Cytobacillus firmus TaxID=1399 RepID=UPI00203BE570|nr:hypothetical protein [Cytobacillus firmus]MCM3705303.1 hypothetical protein [Cytobacillus firmus]